MPHQLKGQRRERANWVWHEKVQWFVRTPAASRLIPPCLKRGLGGTPLITAFSKPLLSEKRLVQHPTASTAFSPTRAVKCHMCCHQSKQWACALAWQHSNARVRRGLSTDRMQGYLRMHVHARARVHTDTDTQTDQLRNHGFVLLDSLDSSMFCSKSPIINILCDSLGFMPKENWWVTSLFQAG